MSLSELPLEVIGFDGAMAIIALCLLALGAKETVSKVLDEDALEREMEEEGLIK